MYAMPRMVARVHEERELLMHKLDGVIELMRVASDLMVRHEKSLVENSAAEARFIDEKVRETTLLISRQLQLCNLSRDRLKELIGLLSKEEADFMPFAGLGFILTQDEPLHNKVREMHEAARTARSHVDRAGAAAAAAAVEN